MNITFEELHASVADCAEIGAMQAIKAYEPTADWLRASEVKRWARAKLIDYKALKALMKRVGIRAKRTGEAKNSPLVYSRLEIKKLMMTSHLCRLQTQTWTETAKPADETK